MGEIRPSNCRGITPRVFQTPVITAATERTQQRPVAAAKNILLYAVVNGADAELAFHGAKCRLDAHLRIIEKFGLVETRFQYNVAKRGLSRAAGVIQTDYLAYLGQ